MRALSIRQPFVELILRGLKTAEVRTRPTRVIGERFWIYASRQHAAGSRRKGGTGVWSLDLAMPGGGLLKALSAVERTEVMLGLAEELMRWSCPGAWSSGRPSFPTHARGRRRRLAVYGR